MVEEAYVSFETAKLLKEKGFDELCVWKYSKGIRAKAGQAIDEYQNSELDDDEYSAPTQQMAMAWLRKKKIYIFINISLNTFFYFYTIYNERNRVLRTIPNFIQYEDAAESAIQYCLTNLI